MTLRFIAGAVCPSCREMDSVQGQLQDGVILSARCVACGWTDVNPEHRPVGEKPPRSADDTAPVPVRLLDEPAVAAPHPSDSSKTASESD